MAIQWDASPVGHRPDVGAVSVSPEPLWLPPITTGRRDGRRRTVVRSEPLFRVAVGGLVEEGLHIVEHDHAAVPDLERL